VECSFRDARFGRVVVATRALFERSSFVGPRFERSRLLETARFDDCDFSTACFGEYELRGATFNRCRFSGTTFEDCSILVAVFAGCVFDDLVASGGLYGRNRFEGMPALEAFRESTPEETRADARAPTPMTARARVLTRAPVFVDEMRRTERWFTGPGAQRFPVSVERAVVIMNNLGLVLTERTEHRRHG
jgi:hypothetical protein